MSAGDPRYASVPAALPGQLPAIQMCDAVIYYKKIVAHFGHVREIPVGVLEARFGKPIVSKRSKARRCWAATTPTTADNHHNGWGRLIHDASHYVFRCRHPSARPHDGGHAQLEREIAAYVAARGWLTPKAPTPKPTREATLLVRLARTSASIERWERKQARAQRAIRKLQRRESAVRRALAMVQS